MGALVSLFLCGAWDREYEVLLRFLRDGSRDGSAGEPVSVWRLGSGVRSSLAFPERWEQRWESW